MYTHLPLSDFKVPMIVWGARGIVITLNSAAKRFFGCSEEDIVGKNFQTFIEPGKSKTNALIRDYTSVPLEQFTSKGPALPDTATIHNVNTATDDVYVLFSLGQFTENNHTRYVFAFQPTSASHPLSLSRGLGGGVQWFFW